MHGHTNVNFILLSVVWFLPSIGLFATRSTGPVCTSHIISIPEAYFSTLNTEADFFTKRWKYLTYHNEALRLRRLYFSIVKSDCFGCPDGVVRYSDFLRATRSRDRIPMGRGFEYPFRAAPRPAQLPLHWVPGLSWG